MKDVTALQQTRELTGARNISHSPRTEKKKKKRKKVSALQQTRELTGVTNISQGATSCTKDVTQTQQRVG